MATGRCRAEVEIQYLQNGGRFENGGRLKIPGDLKMGNLKMKGRFGNKKGDLKVRGNFKMKRFEIEGKLKK